MRSFLSSKPRFEVLSPTTDSGGHWTRGGMGATEPDGGQAPGGLAVVHGSGSTEPHTVPRTGLILSALERIQCMPRAFPKTAPSQVLNPSGEQPGHLSLDDSGTPSPSPSSPVQGSVTREGLKSLRARGCSAAGLIVCSLVRSNHVESVAGTESPSGKPISRLSQDDTGTPAPSSAGVVGSDHSRLPSASKEGRVGVTCPWARGPRGLKRIRLILSPVVRTTHMTRIPGSKTSLSGLSVHLDRSQKSLRRPAKNVATRPGHAQGSEHNSPDGIAPSV
jgi:hypothetical protein